jgi:cytochrome P450
MPWVINRNPRYWGEDAAEFRPERWITQTEDGTIRANKHGGAASNYNEATFLHGPHACIGRDLNRAELRCALAAIFSRFKVERSDGFTGKVNITGYITIKPKGGLHVKLTPIK